MLEALLVLRVLFEGGPYMRKYGISNYKETFFLAFSFFLVYVEQGRSTTATTLTFTTASTSGITWKAKVSQVGNICFLSSLILSKRMRELSFLSFYIFLGKCDYFSIFE